jgi:quercetin dioxygenase-like cupin family protein
VSDLKPFRLRRDEGESVQFHDQTYLLKATGAATGGAFGLNEVTTPRGSGPRLHVHAREDEAFYVLEGRLEVTVGEERFEADEGTFVFAPRNIPHRYEATSPIARQLVFVFPGGWETFFREAARMLADGGPGAAAVDRMGIERGVTSVDPPRG